MSSPEVCAVAFQFFHFLTFEFIMILGCSFRTYWLANSSKAASSFRWFAIRCIMIYSSRHLSYSLAMRLVSGHQILLSTSKIQSWATLPFVYLLYQFCFLCFQLLLLWLNSNLFHQSAIFSPPPSPPHCGAVHEDGTYLSTKVHSPILEEVRLTTPMLLFLILM